MNMSILTKEQQEKIIALIRECGKIMLSAHDIESNEENISAKSGAGNFVTVFDVKVQETLIRGILQILPEARFLAEESASFSEDYSKGICFVIDPIDGTANFIHDMRCSAVSVGMLCDNEPVFGAVYAPYIDEMFVASKGEGAYLNGKPIHTASRTLEEALVSFGTSPYYREELADASFDVAKRLFMKTADIRRSGSAAVDLCFLACGRTDVFFEALLSPWDYAASYVIVTEAGGEMLQMDGQQISLTSPSSVLCVTKSVKNEVLSIINN